MRTILADRGARRWSLSIGLLAGLAALLVTLMPAAEAQAPPPAPHWFWGVDAQAYVGAEIQVYDENGERVELDEEDASGVSEWGDWHVVVPSERATRVRLRLVTDTVSRETDLMDVIVAGFVEEGISITEFKHDVAGLVEEQTIKVRIIARRAADGRIEFGMRGPTGEDILPRARYFPSGGPGHTRWLRSTEIDFGDGFVGRIIARYSAEDGRTEFGFRVEGYDDIFPRARFFPAEGPDHNRFLRSSEVEIGLPRPAE